MGQRFVFVLKIWYAYWYRIWLWFSYLQPTVNWSQLGINFYATVKVNRAIWRVLLRLYTRMWMCVYLVPFRQILGSGFRMYMFVSLTLYFFTVKANKSDRINHPSDYNLKLKAEKKEISPTIYEWKWMALVSSYNIFN